ncbi:MAG: FtsX-like permease family protein [Chloroflexi bacterium]|nr:FtsX-like permease family protein [Chloroflexota bacterium]
MSIVWRKVWRDMWRSKLRTFLVVLSTTVGVFALGFVYGVSGVLTTRITESHQESIPAHLTFYVSLFDQEVVETILRQPDVVDAEGLTETLIRWKVEGETDWENGFVIARDDYDAQRLNLCDLIKGEWPSSSRTGHAVAVEQMAARQWNIPLDGTIVIEFEGYEQRLTVEGIARHPQAAPPPLDYARLFVSPETFAGLIGSGEGFNRLYVRLESFSEDGANEAGERIQERLERMGLGVGGYNVTDPDVHGAQEIIDAVMLILTVLGVASLVLSGFLIVNMMNATVTQQVWQIGVMKVVGASGWRVTRVYLTMALVYGLLSLVLAVPSGAVAAYLLGIVLLRVFNVTAGAFRLMPAAVAIQIVVGLFVPVLAALIPVIGGARITPHQAISNYGLGAGFGRSRFDRLVGRIRRLPRPLTLSLRNTFRRKARIALTMLTLVLGGVMFMAVLSVGTSFNKTLEIILDDFGFDILIAFRRSYRVTQLIDVAERVPGVTSAEVWNQVPAQISLPSGEDREAYLWGIPADSDMFSPRIVSGRAFLPEDGRAILLNSKIAADEGFQVGDEIELTIGEQESTWTVVGLILNVNNLQRDNFVSYDALSREIGSFNQGSLVVVMSEEHDPTTHQRLVTDLRDAYDGRSMEPAILQSIAEVRETNKIVFNAIMYLMLVMAVLAALVGSVGLMSTMSINVVERGREIGVMRAIGATSLTIVGIFIIEGVMLGVLSWLLAVPLSYPGALVFNNLVSTELFQIPLDFDYSLLGTVLWLVIVVVLSGLASLWPALTATQVSVREALAYE